MLYIFAGYPKPEERYPRQPPKSPVHVLSDVSSLSENELDAQRKVIKQKLRRMDLAKRYGSGMHSENRRNAFSRRHKHQLSSRRRPTYHHYTENFHLPRHYPHYSNSPSSSPHHQDDAILVESLDSVTDDELHEYDEDDENEDVLDLERLKLSRDKLRVALAQEERQEMYKNSLRERLQCRLRKSPSSKFTNEFQPLPQNELPLPQMPQQISDTEENTTEQAAAEKDEDPAELKLRLIALKSAMLKKHFARKNAMRSGLIRPPI